MSDTQTIIIETKAKRTICGTDWPVSLQVYKIRAHKWAVVEVCNGFGEQMRVCSTKREALSVAIGLANWREGTR